MADDPALVLLAHGSPDPDWRRPLDAIAEALRAGPAAPRVTVAFLGALAPDLATAVQELAQAGTRRIVVVAAFLSPGGRHIKHDVPALVAEVAARHPELALRLHPGALGAEPEAIAGLAAAAARALHESEPTGDGSDNRAQSPRSHR